MLDARQLADVAAAAGDQQAIVVQLAMLVHKAFLLRLQAGDTSLDEIDPVATQEIVQRHGQILVAAPACRHPDQAREVEQLGARRQQADAPFEALLAQGFHGLAGGKARSHDSDM